MKRFLTMTVFIITALGFSCPADESPAPDVEKHVAAVNAALSASKALLHQYEWVETTTAAVKGKEKLHRQLHCYYGADGHLQKLPVPGTPAPEKKRGLRALVSARKDKEMHEYMDEAIKLVKMYMPPDEERIEAAKKAGKVAFQPMPGDLVKLIFPDYMQPRDRLTIEIDLTTERPTKAEVETYLAWDMKPVTLTIEFGTLNNSATFVSYAVLKAEGKDLIVHVRNTGYRKMNP